MRPATLGLAPPHRLDIDAASLIGGAGCCLFARDEVRARSLVEEAFGDGDGATVAFLSVRSALCAFLQVMQQRWPAGSEVLISALTIKDMAKLIEAHGFVPVAVDIDPETMAPDVADLERRITPRTRAVLVAHLFGGRVDLEPIARVAQRHGLLLLEDCAQAFVGPAWTGHARSDVVMFSFGTLKTMTALGGALVRVRDAHLRAGMRTIQDAWPAQSRRAFASKLAKTALFLLAQVPLVYGLVAHALAAFAGKHIGDVVRSATRGFPAQDTNELRALRSGRAHPCSPSFTRACSPSAPAAPRQRASRSAHGQARVCADASCAAWRARARPRVRTGSSRSSSGPTARAST